MAEFIESALNDKNGQKHSFTYKKGNKLYPADLAYDNKSSLFRIYFVYDMDETSKKDRECVFEMPADGVKTVFELPKDEADIQAIVRTMFMY